MARARPKVDKTCKWGNRTNFWIEYPDGVVDVSETFLSNDLLARTPPKPPGLVDIPVEGDRVVRLDPKRSAIVIIDMQKSVRRHARQVRC